VERPFKYFPELVMKKRSRIQDFASRMKFIEFFEGGQRMARVFRRFLVGIFVVGSFLALVSGADHALASEGDQTVTGVIAETGFGSFILRAGGKEARYNTGRKTSYEPADFRPREGDKVKVTYYDKDHRGKTIQAVSKLELIKANPNFKEPPNPATGTIKEAGRRAYNVYIPKIKKSWKFEMARGVKIVPKGWKPAEDEKVKISYKRVPSRFTGGVVYQIKSIEKLD